MAKLILSLDDVVLEEIPLAKERTTIGRKPHNDIQIDNLAVSGEHAVIVTILNDCFLEDLGSTNGTLVNGVLAKKHLLQNNDVIELGKYKLKFVGMASSPAPTPADYEKTMIWRPGGVKPPAGTRRCAIGAERASRRDAGGACRREARRTPSAAESCPSTGSGATPGRRPGGQGARRPKTRLAPDTPPPAPRAAPGPSRRCHHRRRPPAATRGAPHPPTEESPNRCGRSASSCSAS